MIGLKMGLLVAILAAGGIGGAVPLLRGARGGAGRMLGWGNALAAGILLGAGLIHMLPDATRAWDDLGGRYPLPFLLAALAFVLMLLCEHVLLPEGAHEMVHAPSDQRFALLRAPGRSGLAAYAVVTALSVHSFLAGLALGAQPDVAGALVITVAILAHKSAAGFALGVSLVRASAPRARAWGLLALFAVATPAGILLGIGLDEALEGRARLGFEAAFLALAAGTFAYVAIVDILRDELEEPGGRFATWLLATLGMGAMATIAAWV